jgi:hypothetical protein
MALRRSRILLCVLSVLGAPIAADAQSPSLAGARVRASVELDSHGMFVYKYVIENGAQSTAAISRLSIDVSPPAGAGREFAPVLSATQPGWKTTIGSDGSARWETAQAANLVAPARTLAGFSISSQGPPSIRSYTLAPRIDRDRLPIEPPGDDPGAGDQYNQELEHYIASQSIKGVTLAPGTLKAATADAVIASLVTQVAQARSLGWISSDSISKGIAAKLDAARTTLSRHQLDAARNTLSQLRTEVIAQSGKGLTNEGVALVNMNAQYALRLSAKP